MGLGTGIKCRICGTQLYYGEDTEEICSNDDVCHRCKVDIIKLKEPLEELIWTERG